MTVDDRALAAAGPRGSVEPDRACALLLSIDASTPASPPRTGLLRLGTARAPDGATIGINDRYLTRDSRPWLPVMGEMHYSRVPERQWDDELAKMKAAGIEIVSSYIIWCHHELQAGHFEWSGRRDLRSFVAACGRHGLLFFARIGPWAHAEVRYGGIPGWVVDQTPTRCNDPVYLDYVQRFYAQIAQQLRGELWKDGGPVIGVQIENEYNLTGPEQGAAHIAELKRLAMAAGLDTPLYTVTGWDDAVFPHGEVTPVFGGYPDMPWGSTPDRSAPNEAYAFRFTSRVGGDLGAQTQGGSDGDADKVAGDTPFLGAEYGAGVPTMYRRRPVIDADDVGAMLPVQLGSGVNLYGYYMFHGGRNPPDLREGQESTATGGWNDLPVVNYDFQAPFGANGEAGAVLGKLRPMHAFLREWGSALATYPVHAPAVKPRSADDLHTPRFSVRSDGERGFLFVNNHVRQHSMPAQAGVRFSVRLANRTITLPTDAIDIAPGAYFVWPIALPMADAELRYATAQPMTRLATPGGDTYVFRAVDGIAAEFVFEARTVREIDAAGSVVKRLDDALVVTLEPGTCTSVTTASGCVFTLLLLSAHDAERTTITSFEGLQRLVRSDADVFESNGQLVLRSTDPELAFSIYPPLQRTPIATLPLTRGQDRDGFATYIAKAEARPVTVQLVKLREAREVPPIRQGGPANASVEPVPETFGRSAAWQILIPSNVTAGLANAYLSIRYRGDVGRLFAGTTLVDDHFYNGLPWRISLGDTAASAVSRPLTLTILPLRTDAAIYLDARYDPRPEAERQGLSQTATLDEVRIVSEYELRVGEALKDHS
ncbi:beta-galactosidase (plasmid) [Paraburkholderia sp. PREW-6R]|uniref:beta-galactosidase n=1 Tax=Paraburkholderia sp. PREW-6R TaxID=3141544 RepID=UPI0031F523E1